MSQVIPSHDLVLALMYFKLKSASSSYTCKFATAQWSRCGGTDT